MKIAHKTENFSVDTEGKTNAAVIAEIKDAGFNLGSKSLAALLAGEKTEAGTFQVASEVAAEPVIEAKKEEIKAEVKPEVAAVKPKKESKVKELTAEQIALAAAVEKDIPTKETKPPVEKAPRVLKDVSHLLPKPGTYDPLLKGSTMARLFEMMCRPEGVTKAEMLAPMPEGFGWSAGGMAGIIHWEPKKKGYTLVSEKIDGVLHYFLAYHAADPARPNGHLQRVTLSELLYREKAAAPVVKSAEEKQKEKDAKEAVKAQAKADADAKKAADKEEKVKAKEAAKPAAAEPAPKSSGVKVPKDAPAVSGANVTKRVSAKKAAANAA